LVAKTGGEVTILLLGSALAIVSTFVYVDGGKAGTK
jgi:hypothetical protein